eukprot:3657477-Prymnesium_polylepis.1
MAAARAARANHSRPPDTRTARARVSPPSLPVPCQCRPPCQCPASAALPALAPSCRAATLPPSCH